MSSPLIGQIKLFAGDFAPRGYALCDGQLLNVVQFSALFAVIGTTYGGDGRTTFALPDLRGRAPVHAGHGPGMSPYRLGQRGGAANVVLRVDELPAHTHRWLGIAAASEQTSPADHALAEPSSGGRDGEGAHVYGRAADAVILATDSIDSTGGGEAHDNQQPFVGLSYIIALQGVFPERG